jgi:crotonobetainyl-CoA:carnitine CoA-transferase CaiB-like acyl-CoA transferase
MGGVMHVTGEPDGPPTSVGLPICDLGTGMWAVQGILAALYERQRTGKGRLVECSLLETAIGFSSWTSAQWLADPQVRYRGLVQYAKRRPPAGPFCVLVRTMARSDNSVALAAGTALAPGQIRSGMLGYDGIIGPLCGAHAGRAMRT